MKRVTFIFIIILVLMGCAEDSSKNINKKAAKLTYTDISSNNKEYGTGKVDGQVEITSIKPHSGSISCLAFFKGWKSYERLDISCEEKILKINYNEKNTDEKEDVLISFNLGFYANMQNTELYKNGILHKENIQFAGGME